MGYEYMSLAWFAIELGREPVWAIGDAAIDDLSDEALREHEYSHNVFDWDDLEGPDEARAQLHEQLAFVRDTVLDDDPLLATFDLGRHQVWATGEVDHTTEEIQDSPVSELFRAIQALTVFGVLAAVGFSADLSES
jgi:hypothetical protein